MTGDTHKLDQVMPETAAETAVRHKSENAIESFSGPRIAGEFIRQALLGEVSVPSGSPLVIDSRGARLADAIVEGGLDLSAVKFDRPIAFERCTFLGPIDLREAKLEGISFAGSHAPRIEAKLAEIGGDLDLRGARLESPGRTALGGEAIRVAGSIHLAVGFVAHGTVDLTEAHITGSLNCGGGSFHHPRPNQPVLEWLKVGNTALFCGGIEIGQSLLLDQGFSAEGRVMMPHAQIGKSLFVTNASFTAGSGSLSGLVVQNGRIGGPIVLLNTENFEGLLSLRATVARRLVDDSSLWWDSKTLKPRHGIEIVIDDFCYESFIAPVGAQTDLSWRTRLAWLKMQRKEHWTTEFHSQPFTRCAEVLRNMGDAHGARMILFERERLRLKSKNVVFWERISGHLQGALAGYGYKKHYALYWALGVWLVGAAIFGVADRLDLMRPASEDVLVDAQYQQTGRVPADYEPMKPLLFSADTLLPIMDIGQERFWLPRDAGERKPDAAAVFPSLPGSVASAVNWLFGGWLPKGYYYFEIAMGWLLVSIVIAGFSGLLGHAREE